MRWMVREQAHHISIEEYASTRNLLEIGYDLWLGHMDHTFVVMKD